MTSFGIALKNLLKQEHIDLCLVSDSKTDEDAFWIHIDLQQNPTPEQVVQRIHEAKIQTRKLFYQETDDANNQMLSLFYYRRRLLVPSLDEEDYEKYVTIDEIRHLYGSGGAVELVDFFPRIVPKGRTPEYMVVQAARTSFRKDYRNEEAIETDERLIRYMFNNEHTSPFEMCSITFNIIVPLAISTQILRHRTLKFSKVNGYSRRYSNESVESRFDILKYQHGIRIADKVNKQSSVSVNKDHPKYEQIVAHLEKANKLAAELHQMYQTLLEDGLAKECARFYLTEGEYTKLTIQFDLHNFFHFLNLRLDPSAQKETQVVAEAMQKIAEQIFPVSFRQFELRNQKMVLTPDEVDAIRENKELDTPSVSAQATYIKKRKRLNLPDIPKLERKP